MAVPFVIYHSSRLFWQRSSDPTEDRQGALHRAAAGHDEDKCE
jgi:hypothetical protein